MRDEFSVFWYDPEGNTNCEKRYLNAEAAVNLARDLSQRPAAMFGVVQKIIIVDGSDFVVFEWLFGKGVVFPERLAQ